MQVSQATRLLSVTIGVDQGTLDAIIDRLALLHFLEEASHRWVAYGRLGLKTIYDRALSLSPRQRVASDREAKQGDSWRCNPD